MPGIPGLEEASLIPSRQAMRAAVRSTQRAATSSSGSGGSAGGGRGGRGGRGGKRGGGARLLKVGSSGKLVKALQRRLNVKVTGTYDHSLRRRVRQFQRRKGIQVDGVVGTQTVHALRGTTSGVSPGTLVHHDLRYLRRQLKSGPVRAELSNPRFRRETFLSRAIG